MKKAFAVILLAALVAGSLFAGGQRARTPDNHLIAVQPMLPTNFDPHMASEVPAGRATYLIFQTLVYQDEQGNFLPGLATSWDFQDAQTVIFTIRQGVRFHNGDIMTADDVAYSLTRSSVSPFTAPITNFIREAVVINPTQVRVSTHAPFAPMLANLSHGGSSIVNRAVVERLGTDHGFNPVGTGPYRFHTFVTGDRYELIRFDEFSSVAHGLPPGQLPQIEHITFRLVPEPGVRTIELETGAAHVAIDVAASEVARVRAHRDLTMHEIPNFAVNTWLGFNVSKPPFNDLRVRQAVSLALDIESIVDVAWAGVGIVARGPLPTTVRGAEVYPIPQQNIARARQLMAEAGYANGFSTDLWLNEGNQMRADAAIMIQAQLRALNIETQINIYEWAILLPATAEGEHQMSLMGWTTSTGEADYGLFPLYHSSSFGATGNRFFYHSPRVDQLLNTGRNVVDDGQRMAAYREAQDIIMRDMPMIPLWQAAELHGTRNNIEGLNINGAGNLRFWTVRIR